MKNMKNTPAPRKRDHVAAVVEELALASLPLRQRRRAERKLRAAGVDPSQAHRYLW